MSEPDAVGCIAWATGGGVSAADADTWVGDAKMSIN